MTPAVMVRKLLSKGLLITVACTSNDEKNRTPIVDTSGAAKVVSPTSDASVLSVDECQRIASMIRAHVTSHAGGQSRGTSFTGPDSIDFPYQWARVTTPGCQIVVAGSDSVSRAAVLGDIDSLLVNAGWTPADSLYSADGPDGSLRGFLKAPVLCVRESRWDGGDDSDSTYVPKPDFTVQVRCAPHRADDRPPI